MGWDNTTNQTRFFSIGTGLSYDQGTNTLSSIATGFVESVTGNGVDNTDPFNPIIKTANSTTEGTLSAADWNKFNDNVTTYDSASIYSNSGFSAPYGATTDIVYTANSYSSTLVSGTPASGIFTLLKDCNTLRGSFCATVTKLSTDNTIATNGVFRVYVNGVVVTTTSDMSFTDLADTTDKQRSSPMSKSFILKNLVIGDTVQIKFISSSGSGGSGYNISFPQLTLERLK